MITTDHQPRGDAAEATGAAAAWLRSRGIRSLTAHVAPGHAGSERVAARTGMQPSGDVDGDGEQIWRLDTSRSR